MPPWKIGRCPKGLFRPSVWGHPWGHINKAIDVSGRKGLETQHFVSGRWMSPDDSDVLLFSDAEAREDPPEQFITRHLSRDLPERLMRVAKLLRHEFAGVALY